MEDYDFTESFRRTLAFAREEALALRHDYISPEHILLALASSDDPTLLEIWSSLATDPADIQRATLASFPTGQAEHPVLDIRYTSGAKRTLEFAMREAKALKDHGVAPIHLLLGITRLKNEVAADLLRELRITTDQVRAILADMRGEPLPELPASWIEVTIQLQGGGVIQKSFAGGDAEVLRFVSGYLPR